MLPSSLLFLLPLSPLPSLLPLPLPLSTDEDKFLDLNAPVRSCPFSQSWLKRHTSRWKMSGNE